MNTQANAIKSPFHLTWNQVGSEEWQSGGLARYYSIMQDGDRFTVTLCDLERRIRTVATANSLQAAKDAALIDFSKAK